MTRSGRNDREMFFPLLGLLTVGFVFAGWRWVVLPLNRLLEVATDLDERPGPRRKASLPGPPNSSAEAFTGDLGRLHSATSNPAAPTAEPASASPDEFVNRR